MTITPVSLDSIRFPNAAAATGPAASKDPFGEALRAAVARVEGASAEATASAERFLNGEGEELHQVALNAQRAALQFELFLQMRNKAVEAYHEVMRQQL
jgi:flagellar hook-basal body complex protein FliE